MFDTVFAQIIAPNAVRKPLCAVLLGETPFWRRGAPFYRMVRRSDASVRRFTSWCAMLVAWCAVLCRGAPFWSLGAQFYTVVRDFSSWCAVLLLGALFYVVVRAFEGGNLLAVANIHAFSRLKA